jgi:outer membrane receptor for ferrienterochelin and colicins
MTSLLIVLAGMAAANPESAPSVDDLSLSDLMSLTIVTASKEPERINDAPGSISTLSRDEIDRLGPVTLREILSTMPGVSPSSGYLFDRSSIAVQGDMTKQTTSHILMLVNGRPIREVMEGGLSSDVLEGFPTSAIDHIELIKGPGAVLYGSDAFTGVINIITRKPVDDRAMATVMGSSGWGRRADGSMELVSGDLKILQAITYNRTEMIDANYVYKTGTGAVINLPIHYAPTSYGSHTQVDYLDFSAFVGYDRSSEYNQIRGIINHTVMEKTYANLGYGFKLNDWWNVDMNSGITRSELKADTFPYSDRNSYEALGELTNHLRFGAGGKAVLGGVVDYREGQEKNWSNGQTMNDASFTGFSGYGQVSYPVLKPLEVFGGAQYNQVSDLKPALAPRAGLIWTINDKLSTKAFWTNAFRAPSLNELTIDAPTQKGNRSLLPEKVETWDLSVSFTGNGLYASGNVFYSRLEDIIQAMPTSKKLGTQTILQYQNAQNIQLMGAGCEIKAYLTKAVLLSGSANYQEPMNALDQWDFLPIPLVTGKLGASYVSSKGWELGMSTLINSDYSDTFTTAKLNPVPGLSVQTNLNGRITLDRMLGLKGRQGLSLRGQVKNLFDEYNWIPEWGGTSHDNLPNLRGRMYYLGLEMKV